MSDEWERAGDGCSCWVNPEPWTYYGIVKPGDALSPDPHCLEHFPQPSPGPPSFAERMAAQSVRAWELKKLTP